MRKHFIAVALVVISMVGCSSDSSSETEESSKEIVMVIDTTYEVNKGDKVEKRSEDATLKIDKNSNKEATEVTLIKGEAVLIKN